VRAEPNDLKSLRGTIVRLEADVDAETSGEASLSSVAPAASHLTKLVMATASARAELCWNGLDVSIAASVAFCICLRRLGTGHHGRWHRTIYTSAPPSMPRRVSQIAAGNESLARLDSLR